jgi:hypothetical protein
MSDKLLPPDSLPRNTGQEFDRQHSSFRYEQKQKQNRCNVNHA